MTKELELDLYNIELSQEHIEEEPLTEVYFSDLSAVGPSKRILLATRLGSNKKKIADNLILAQEWFIEFDNEEDRLVKLNSIKTQKLISNYKGLRHSQNMPVRGQRSRTNAKTRRKRKIF